MSTSLRTHETLRSDEAISAYGAARSTVEGTPLSRDELHGIDAYWRASLYLCLGMLYLKANPLLREPLKLEHIKPRLLGRRASVYLHPLQPADQKVRPEGDLHQWPRARSTRCIVTGVSRRDVRRGLSGKERRRRRTRALLQAILFPWGHRQPRHPRDAGQHPRRRRARLQHLARLRDGLRQPGPDQSGDGRRRRV